MNKNVPFTTNEREAKARLEGYVYEYLVHIGANNTADSFKNEVINKGPEVQVTMGEPPGFLYNWWCVFWDLYSAMPERRDKSEPTREAIAFHDCLVSGPGPLMNGMNGPQFANGPPVGLIRGGMPPQGVDGGFNGGYMPPRGTRSGAPTPVMGVAQNFPPGQPQQMFLNEQQMRMGIAQGAMAVRMPQGPMGVRMNFQPGPGHGGPIRPQMRQYIESPSSASNYPPNGNMCPSTASIMSSPGQGGQPGNMPPGSDSIPSDRFMMMNHNIPPQFMNHPQMQESGTPVGNGGPSSMSGNINAGNNEGSISLGASGNGQMQNMLNGGDQCGDVKQSPSSFHGTNTAGGTPGSGGPQSTPVNMLASGGPGSVVGGGPESVHSQSGAVPPNGGNSTPQQQTTPTEGSSKDFMQHQGNGDDHQEISKIKASLMDMEHTTYGPFGGSQ